MDSTDKIKESFERRQRMLRIEFFNAMAKHEEQKLRSLPGVGKARSKKPAAHGGANVAAEVSAEYAGKK